MFRQLVVLVAAVATAAFPLPAQELVRDVDARIDNGDSSPAGFLTLNGVTYFGAQDGVTGRNLWRTDGTASGTWLVKDLRAGSSTSVDITALTPFANGFVFLERYLSSGAWNLWVSDGTGAGTRLVNAATGISEYTVSPRPLAVVGDKVLFCAWSSTTGHELHSFDGTSVTLVKDINPGTTGNAIDHFAVVGSTAYFAADDGTHGTELWKSDGTSAGTVMVANIASGIAASSPAQITTVGSRVVFFASDDSHGYEIWRSNGTSAGTDLLLDVVSGSSSGYPADLVAAAGKAFFVAGPSYAGSGRELYVTDGTPGGTRMVVDLAAGSASGVPSDDPGTIAPFGSGVLFRGSDGTVFNELFFSDGTAAGTRLVADIAPGLTTGSVPIGMREVGGVAYFQAWGRPDDPEIWRTDGTAVGTWRVRDIRPGVHGSAPADFVAIGNSCLFSALEPLTGREPWITDGTEAGTRMVADLDVVQPVPWSGTLTLATSASIGDRLVFLGDDGITGREPWLSDGSAAGTILLRDIDTQGQQVGSGFSSYGGRVWFAAREPVTGFEPWISDGTTAGTVLLADLVPGSGGSAPVFLCGSNGKMFFCAQDPTTGNELYVSDGTAAGTHLVIDLRPGIDSGIRANDVSAVPLGDGILFTGVDASARFGLFFTDGTAAGTRVVLNPTTSLLNPRGLVSWRGEAWFQASDPTHGIELWHSDGTTAGTTLVVDIRAGIGSSTPEQLTVAGERLFFTAETGTAGRELWCTLGDAASTSMMADIDPGSGDSNPSHLTAARDHLFFTASDPDGADLGTELYFSDGTSAGTQLVRDFAPGPYSGCREIFVPPGSSRALVTAYVPVAFGESFWTSDGSPAGTILFFDLEPPGARTAGSASFLGLAGDKLLFAASDGVTGVELHAVSMGALGAPYAVNFGAGCAGSGGQVPAIGVASLPWIGNQAFAITLAHARAASPCAVLLNSSILPIALPPCTVYPTLPAIALNAFTAPGGDTSLPIAVPDDVALIGVVFIAQWVVVDPAGAWGGLLAMSDAVAFLIGR